MISKHVFFCGNPEPCPGLWPAHELVLPPTNEQMQCPSSKTKAGGHWVEVEERVQEIVLEFRSQQSEQGWGLADNPEFFSFPVDGR